MARSRRWSIEAHLNDGGRLKIAEAILAYGRMLPPGELIVLSFIYDRTYGWNNSSEDIPERHFLNGVTTRRRGRICPGTGLGLQALRDAIQGLRQRGAITIHTVGTRTFYEINLSWREDGFRPMRQVVETDYRYPAG